MEVPGEGELVNQGVQPLEFMPGFNLEGYPNRDSLVYRQLYGIETVHTMLRGTIRYKVQLHALTSSNNNELFKRCRQCTDVHGFISVTRPHPIRQSPAKY